MPKHDIIVVGASAGGVEALSKLVHGLPADFPATIFIVLHLSPQSPSMLPKILQRATPLTVVSAEDRLPIRPGMIFVAPADMHLLVGEGEVRVIRGPKENRHRPAIDPLFRSATYTYGPRVVGVVLTGSLDDGTAGLKAIKDRGGIAVVQDPEEAFYPSMPQSALDHVAVDYRLPLAEIGPLLGRLAHDPVPIADAPEPSRQMELEVKLAEMNGSVMHADERPGKPSVFSCPECNGVLYELADDELVRFRCRTGHAFSAESVLAEQAEALEDALWAALNTLEETAMLSRRMGDRARESGHTILQARFEAKVRDAEARAEVLRRVLHGADSFAGDATPGSE